MALVSGAVFLLVSLYITADVIGRRFLGVSTAVSDEFGGYALAVGGMWALAYTLRQGAHVRIDVLLPYLPDGMRALLNYAALVLMAFFAAVVSAYVWRLTFDSLAIDARAMSFLRTPLVVPQGLMAVGFTVLTLEAVVILLVGLVESLGRGRLVPPEGLESAGPVEGAR
jgi:TRAP-type C4-dicarboxylate transport system permease small subunit